MNEYWIDRMIDTQNKLTDKNIADVEKQLTKYYSSSMKRVIKEFEATYDKVMLAMVENKQITPADLYKLNKYWEMQGDIRKELEKLGNKQIVLLSKEFEKEYKQIYSSIAFPSQKAFATQSKEGVKQMINQVWCADGKNWSERVWGNTDKLAQTLNDELIHCVNTGAKTSHLKQVLQQRFEVSYRQANTIARTEMAHLQAQAAAARYKEYGITEVKMVIEPDACELCQKHLHETFNVNEVIPCPAHPNCRCAIAPIINV